MYFLCLFYRDLLLWFDVIFVFTFVEVISCSVFLCPKYKYLFLFYCFKCFPQRQLKITYKFRFFPNQFRCWYKMSFSYEYYELRLSWVKAFSISAVDFVDLQIFLTFLAWHGPNQTTSGLVNIDTNAKNFIFLIVDLN